MTFHDDDDDDDDDDDEDDDDELSLRYSWSTKSV